MKITIKISNFDSCQKCKVSSTWKDCASLKMLCTLCMSLTDICESIIHTASVANKVYLPYLWTADNLCRPRRTSTITIAASGKLDNRVNIRGRYTTLWKCLILWVHLHTASVTNKVIILTSYNDEEQPSDLSNGEYNNNVVHMHGYPSPRRAILKYTDLQNTDIHFVHMLLDTHNTQRCYPPDLRSHIEVHRFTGM